MPNPNPYAHIYVDLVMAFARNCRCQLDLAAREALYEFISDTAVAAIEAGEGAYTNRGREYLLGRFADIGAKFAALSEDRVLTGDEVVQVVKAAVDEARQETADSLKHQPLWIFCPFYQTGNPNPLDGLPPPPSPSMGPAAMP